MKKFKLILFFLLFTTNYLSVEASGVCETEEIEEIINVSVDGLSSQFELKQIRSTVQKNSEIRKKFEKEVLGFRSIPFLGNCTQYNLNKMYFEAENVFVKPKICPQLRKHTYQSKTSYRSSSEEVYSDLIV